MRTFPTCQKICPSYQKQNLNLKNWKLIKNDFTVKIKLCTFEMNKYFNSFKKSPRNANIVVLHKATILSARSLPGKQKILSKDSGFCKHFLNFKASNME